MAEALTVEELVRLNALVDPARAMRAAPKLARQLSEAQAAWARGGEHMASGKLLGLASSALLAQASRIEHLEREIESMRNRYGAAPGMLGVEMQREDNAALADHISREHALSGANNDR